MKRPSIKTLQEFAKSYFPDKPCPKIKWRRSISPANGEALISENIILLNPNSEMMEDNSAYIEVLSHESGKNPNLSKGEKIFKILIHEIGHFIFDGFSADPPKSWIRIKETLEKEYPNDLESQLYCFQDYLKQKKGESFEKYVIRIIIFDAWLKTGEFPAEHKRVYEWEIDEFNKRRDEIRRLLE